MKIISLNTNRLILLYFCLSIFSCTEDPVVPISEEEPALWRVHDQFAGRRKIKTNCFASEGFIAFDGPSYFSLILDGEESSVKHYYSTSDPHFYRMPISGKVVVSVDDARAYFDQPLFKNSTSNGSAMIATEQDANFEYWDLGYVPQRGFFQINNQMQVLLPYKTSVHSQSSFFLVSLSIENDVYLRIAEITKIQIPHPYDGEYSVKMVKAVDDFFIVSIGEKTYKVTSTGQFRQVEDNGMDNMFRIGDQLYGTSYFSSFRSGDMGESWSKFSPLPFSLSYANYFPLGDSLVATTDSNLFTVNFDQNSYHYRELDNSSLEGHEITGLATYKDSVYATTYSGVFVKALKDFFESK